MLRVNCFRSKRIKIMAEENISIPRMPQCCKSFFKMKFFRTKTKQECYDKNTYSFVSYM